MARAISGGLASSTFLTLLVMPTYYRLSTVWWEGLVAGLRRWSRRGEETPVESGSSVAG